VGPKGSGNLPWSAMIEKDSHRASSAAMTCQP
jgi:hypothetical protein